MSAKSKSPQICKTSNSPDDSFQARPLLPLVRVPMVLVVGLGAALLGYLSVQQVNPAFGFDKASAQLLILGQQMALLHLVGAFALIGGLRHQRPRLLQQLNKFTHICRRGKRAMPRNDLRIRRSQAEDLLDPSNHPADTPAAPHIDENHT